MRPFSVGITPPEKRHDWQAVEKKTDIFFVGNTRYSWVREEGLRQLEELRAEGLKVDLLVPSATQPSIPLDEFLRRCSESWLTWSPEGAGWDCMRHYWAPLMGSVPVMNHPDTQRHHPHIDGVHGFYYAVEGDDLKRVIQQALQDKAHLRKMAWMEKLLSATITRIRADGPPGLGDIKHRRAGSNNELKHPQVIAVGILAHGSDQPGEALAADPALPQRDFFQAGDLQTLPVLNG